MYIWEKYRTFEITAGIILKTNYRYTKVLHWKLLINGDRWPHWTGDRYMYIKLKYIVKCTGRARKWPLWAGDHYTKVTVTTGLTVHVYCHLLPMYASLDVVPAILCLMASLVTHTWLYCDTLHDQLFSSYTITVYLYCSIPTRNFWRHQI